MKWKGMREMRAMIAMIAIEGNLGYHIYYEIEL